MIDAIAQSALAPFMEQVGWQGFAYGVAGKVVLKRAKGFIDGWRAPENKQDS